MLDDVGRQNFFKSIHDMWIMPEIQKRFGETIPAEFQIRHCLIRLQQSAPPIVEFNDEVGWEVENLVLAPGVTMEAGKLIYLHEIMGIGSVLPPLVEGKRVAFVYLYWVGYEYRCFFDFTPNQDDFDPDNPEYQFDGAAVAHHLSNLLIERSVRLTRNIEPALRQVGLWVATPLLPYPISKLVERIGEGELEEARQLLVSHCTPAFIADKLVRTWVHIGAFQRRSTLFDDALFLHENRRYVGSISVLITQIEGVIADWLHDVTTDVKWSISSRVEMFRSLILTIPQFEFAYREALESTIEFLKEGETAPKPFQKFKDWLAKVDPNFPARHAIAHGKYEPAIFTEENSIKLFLLLDTICQFMMFYEARKLGRTFVENKGDETE